MKTFWKLLGAAALVAGLTPYKVEENDETGEKSYQALLWRITSKPAEDEDKREIGINLGEGTLTEKLWDMVDKSEEPHLFSDELCVEYNGVPVTADAAPEAPAEAEEPAEAAAEVPAEEEEPAADEAAAEPATPEEPEEPAEASVEDEKEEA